MPAPPVRQQRALLRSGDHEVFSLLFTTHSGEVFTTALRLTGSRSAAEEVTSETFLVAWRRRGDVEVNDLPLRGWLLAIAAHQAMNVTRGRRRWLAFLGSERMRPGAVADFADEAVSRIDDRQRLDRTRRALSELTRRELEVVSLCLWSDLSYQEAADALGIPVGTVRSRLNRARTRLRDLVADAEQTAPALPHPLDRGAR